VEVDGAPWLYAAATVAHSEGADCGGAVWVAARELTGPRLQTAERLSGGSVRLAHGEQAEGSGPWVPLVHGGEGTGWRVSVTPADRTGDALAGHLVVLAANTTALGFAVMVTLALLLDRLVLGRLFRLAGEVGRMQSRGDDFRIEVRGNDELDRVARAVNSLANATQALREKSVHDAMHDGLTGLPNRALLQDRMAVALRQAERAPDRHFALLLVDLDRIKGVNDLLGHAAGDRFIVAAAQRIAAGLRAGDTVSRLGGDEFAVILAAVTRFDVAAARAAKLLAVLREPVDLEGQDHQLTASVGITFSRAGASVAELLTEADTAMYASKQAGRDRWSIFDPEMHKEAAERNALERALRAALTTPDFGVHFQPIYDLDGARLVGFEALARWTDAERGTVPPDRFIAVAEASQLIVELDAVMLERAVAAFAPWARARPGLVISVNCSARRFDATGLVPDVVAVVARHGLPTGALVLEVTETQFAQGESRWSTRIRELAECGVRVALDDFGAGYSSLTRLRAAPVAMLKLDRSFVDQVGRGDDAVAVAIVRMAAALSLPVIAEGIETGEVGAQLAGLGCRYGQGWHYGRPMPAEAAAELVAAEAPTAGSPPGEANPR
jgi:diguanylate cyclase (GGDEF)-like protein